MIYRPEHIHKTMSWNVICIIYLYFIPINSSFEFFDDSNCRCCYFLRFGCAFVSNHAPRRRWRWPTVTTVLLGARWSKVVPLNEPRTYTLHPLHNWRNDEIQLQMLIKRDENKNSIAKHSECWRRLPTALTHTLLDSIKNYFQITSINGISIAKTGLHILHK